MCAWCWIKRSLTLSSIEPNILDYTGTWFLIFIKTIWLNRAELHGHSKCIQAINGASSQDKNELKAGVIFNFRDWRTNWRFCVRVMGCVPCTYSLQHCLQCWFSRSIDVNWPSFGKGENESQLIDIDSQPHQTMFQYTDSICNPSRIRNMKIERSKQLCHNSTLPLFPLCRN